MGKMWIPESGEITWIFPDIKRIEVRIDGQIGFVGSVKSSMKK